MNIPKTISFSIDVTKIEPSQIREDEQGRKWLRMKMLNTPDSKWQKDYMVIHDVPQEERESSDTRLPILGNARVWGPDEGRMAPRHDDAKAQSVDFQSTKPNAGSDLPF